MRTREYNFLDEIHGSVWYSLQVRVSGVWMNVSENNVPCLYKTSRERDDKRKYFSKLKVEDTSINTKRVCNDCDWTGSNNDCVYPKHNPSMLLCPECHETTFQYTSFNLGEPIDTPNI